MSEQNDITLLRVQKELKPNIEDFISHVFDGEYWDNVLDFIAWLRENKMKPKWSGLRNAWNANSKGKVLYYIRLGGFGDKYPDCNYPGRWVITPYLLNVRNYEDKIFKEGLQDFIWEHLNHCNICVQGHKESKGKEKKIVLGKEFTEFGCAGDDCKIWVSKADKVTIGNLKKLLEWEKQARNNK